MYKSGIRRDRLAATPIVFVVIEGSVVQKANLLAADLTLRVVREDFLFEGARKAAFRIGRIDRLHKGSEAAEPSLEGIADAVCVSGSTAYAVNPGLVARQEIHVLLEDSISRVSDLVEIVLGERNCDYLENRCIYTRRPFAATPYVGSS